ncbi:MAG: hypothetical protein M3R32_03325 [Chloroflexota bacterium]|nr:hypothetical protein [Chloroflexota bacterium]
MKAMLRLGSALVVVAVVVACGRDAAVSSPSAGQSAAASLPTDAPTAAEPVPSSSIDRVPLPSGFPVLPGAVPMNMADDDPGLIGLWSSDQRGSAAYDFYVSALPAAGYPIVGLYPGGDVAVIRFRSGDAIWQMVAQGGAGGTEAIEVRLDRP